MSKEKAFGFLPVSVKYTDDIKTGGEAFGPFIKIKHKHKDDFGLFRHELKHAEQWYSWLFIGLIVAGLVGYFVSLQFVPALAILSFVLHNVLYRIPEYRYRIHITYVNKVVFIMRIMFCDGNLTAK